MGEHALVPPAHPSSAAPVEPHVYPSPCRAVGLGGQMVMCRSTATGCGFSTFIQKDQALPGPACMGWPLLCHGPAPAGQMLLPPPKPDAGRSGKDLHFPSWTRMLCISPSGQAAHPLPHPSSATQHLLSPEDPAPALLPPPRWYAVMGGAALLLPCSW